MSHSQPQTYPVLRSQIFAKVSATQRVFLLGIALFFACILFYLGTSAPQALADELAPEAPGSLGGVIRNAQGEPLAGIQVTLYQIYPYQNSTWSGVRTITTGANGIYQFALLPVGIYRIGVNDPQRSYAPMYYPAASTLYRATDITVQGNQRTNIDLTLQPSSQIRGTITASDGMSFTQIYMTLVQPLERLGNNTWQVVQTLPTVDSSGVYSFTNLSANTYRLCVNANTVDDAFYECYDNVYAVSRATDIVLTAGMTISNVNMTLGDDVDYAQIGGRVVGPANEPLADILVTAQIVPAAAASAASDAAADTILAQPTATPQVGQLLPPPYFEYPYEYPYNEYPYQNYYVTFTDSQGNYQLPTLTASRYILQFSDPANHYALEYYDNTQIQQEATILQVAPKQIISDVNVQLELGGHLVGSITILGQPATYANVMVERKTPFGWYFVHNGQLDVSTGRYDIGGLAAGTYRLAAYGTIADGFTAYYYQGYFGGTTAENAAEITLAAGESKTADIALTGTEQFEGSLSGQITAGGAPLAGAKVSLYHSDYDYCCDPTLLRQLIYVYTDVEGRYRVDGLANGRVRIRAVAPAGIYATTYYTDAILLSTASSVVVGGGTNVTGVDIDLPSGGTITGRVIQRNGQPVAGLALTLYAPRLRDPMYGSMPIIQTDNLQTDADGRYTISGLYAGDYYLCFRDQRSGNMECYGTPYLDFYQVNEYALVNVVAGATTTADLMWGPDLMYYLPFVPQ